MGYFEDKHKDLGEVSPKQKKTFTYSAKTEVPNVEEITVSCPCFTPVLNSKEGTLTVYYTAPKFPHHITGSTYTTQKNMTVKYSTGESEVLSFGARVVR